MYFIQSERLKLIPLAYEQLLLSQQNLAALEAQLGLNPSAMEISEEFSIELNAAIQYNLLPNTKLYPDLYQWYTNWQIVYKPTNTIIGGIGFSNYPDDFGETRVGYFISIPHQGKGFASEALQTLLGWGFSFSVLKAVKADTMLYNYASQRVLSNAGFKRTAMEDSYLYYRVTRLLLNK